MFEIPSLNFVYGLFSWGLVFGAGLGAAVWIIGYAISSLFKIMRK